MPENPIDAPAPDERRAVGALSSAMLLAATGGALDAFVYLNHGHVFAASMTGNGVLLGVTVLHRDWIHAVSHILPMLAFAVGVFLSRLLDGNLKRHAVTVGLLCEIVALFLASFLPGSFPDLAFVPLLAIVGAYQVDSFRSADSFSYNSTFLTGNLRTAVDGLYQTLNPASRSKGWHQFRSLSFIVAAFLAGAISGAILAPHWLNHTLWFVDLPLLIVLGMTLRRVSHIPKIDAGRA